MSEGVKNIYVYADWYWLGGPKLVGTLTSEYVRGKNVFLFEFDESFLVSKERVLLDPNLSFFKGRQFPYGETNFGMFFDSMPDSWGRTLMKRREAILARMEGRQARTLTDVDFLLGVYDKTRSGALRFKLDPKGDFLDNNPLYPTPPLNSVRNLQYAVSVIENESRTEEINKWLAVLLAPGSSLGGARPKSNVLDEQGNLWIAKFPSKNDVIDKAAWEFLAYRLALKSKINMSASKLQKVIGSHHTFFTKRFDRIGEKRIHFASAMTMCNYDEAKLKENEASYLDIAEFIQTAGANIKADLEQLWRRIVFNIAISNTDDHLRNHGFILTKKGWVLSPAFDVNPSVDKDGLAINIDEVNNQLDFELAKSIGEYFGLSKKKMDEILCEITEALSSWRSEAERLGIPNNEILLMESAFRTG